MDVDCPLLDPRVESTLLKHHCVTTNQQVVCLLLCTSKSVTQAVKSACCGLVNIVLQCTEQQQQKPLQLSAWLTSHACLVRDLNLDLQLSIGYGVNWREAIAAIASSLRAASAVGDLQLQHCDISRTKASAAILAALPSSTTSLGCWLEYTGPEMTAIPALTALRSLKLNYTAGYDNVALQLPARLQECTSLEPLTALQQLTSISLLSIRPVHLQHLPVQLRELRADVMGSPFVGEAKQQLCLPHLTALTRLESRAQLMAHRLRQEDILPPNLQVLVWPDLDSTVTPLLLLRSLQQLELHHCYNTPVDQLQQLCDSIACLNTIKMTYVSGQALSHAAKGLAVLPPAALSCLKALTIDLSMHSGFGCGLVAAGGSGEACVPAAVVEELHKLRGLTSLTIKGLCPSPGCRQDVSKSVLDASPQQLARTLKVLTSLKQLQLEGFDSLSLEYQMLWDDAGPSAIAGAIATVLGMPAVGMQRMVQDVTTAVRPTADHDSGFAELFRVFANMPDLKRLKVALPSPLQLEAEAVMQLTVATRLSSLELFGLGDIEDHVRAVFCSSLPDLDIFSVSASRYGLQS